MWFALWRAIIWSRDTPCRTRVHDRPLRRRACASVARSPPSAAPTTPARPMSHLQPARFDENAAPDDLAGLAMPLTVPPPRRKYIGGWRSLSRPGQPPTKWAGGAAPEISKTQTKSVVAAAPSASPQRTSCRVVSAGWPSSPDAAIGEQRVEAGAFVHFVEVRRGPGRRRDRPSVRAVDRRAVDVVQQPLGEVGGGREVLQALLILDADRVAAEFVGDSRRGDVHLALVEDLFQSELGLRILAKVERHAFLDEPIINGASASPR